MEDGRLTSAQSLHAQSLQRMLQQPDASARLRAALHAGTHPEAAFVEVLMRQCRVDDDFYVRDMLTWALTRQNRELVTSALRSELEAAGGGESSVQGLSQALHTASKVADARLWSSITPSMIAHPELTVATTAWRAANATVPSDQRSALVRLLLQQFGRGDVEALRSLARAVADSGDASESALEDFSHRSAEHAEFARMVRGLIDDPMGAIEFSVAFAKRARALGGWGPV